MQANSLMPVKYIDGEKDIYLTTYADTVVYDGSGGKKTLCAIRFGGYPEQVDGMTQAIHGGGAVEVEINGEKITLRPLLKCYRRQISHDGVYAEAVLIAEDDQRQEKKKDQNEPEKGDDDLEGKTELDLPPRNSFIYVPQGDGRALYEAIDQKTGVPMIPEFADYIIAELKKKKILKQLTIASSSQKFEAWMLKCAKGDENIVKVVEKGILTGEIAIPNASSVKDGQSLADITTVTKYLNVFGPEIAARIQNLFTPLFSPGIDQLSPEVLEINSTIQENAGYSLYDAQLAVAESIKRQLQRRKVGLIVAECGSGKTKIGSAAMASVLAALTANGRIGKSFNIVLCPSHIKEKWIREIEETLPNTFAGIANTITELNAIYHQYEKGGKSCYVIMSKEMARDGYMHMPSVRWSESKQGFICPDCGRVIQMPISRDGARYIVDANQFFFKTQHKDNHKCEHCGTPLWAAVNPSIKRKSDWVKVSNYGFVFQPQAFRHLHKIKNAEVHEKLYKILEQPETVVTAKGAHRKFPLSTYVKKHYKGRIDGLIVDELHEYNNDSGQGDAMAELFGVAKKVVGMTGTLINGYSSGIFYLLYRLMPSVMIADGKSYTNPIDFITEYGVMENTYEITEADYNANRRTVKKKKNSRLLPGVSPLIYSRFLLEYAAFLSLSDMGKDLPDYEEIPVPVTMPEEVEAHYNFMQNTLREYMRENKKTAKKILSAYLNLLTAYPDQPYNQPPILHPFEGFPIIEPPDIGDIDTIFPKDQALMDIVKRKIDAGERVLIYTNWTRLDTQKKILKLMTDEGYHAEILSAKVNPAKREQWIEDRVNNGIQVLIVNPMLVQTGLDLIPFTTLIFYDIGHKLFPFCQACRRSWRINQKYPRIEVYMLYYQDTMQHKALKLMASKLAVAGIIEGGYSEEGLAAMHQCDDMTSQMAKELMLGIKDSVEDVSSAFKRMAFIKQKDQEITKGTSIFINEPVKIQADPRTKPQIVEFTFITPVSNVSKSTTALETSHFPIPSITKNKTKKRYEAMNNQVSIFDLGFTA